MPSVRHHAALGHIAPRERGAVQPTARGVLPFRFAGQRFAGPRRVRECILVHPHEEHDVWHLIQKADQRMYEQKQGPTGLN
ncbi:hypothetical protein ACFSC4_28975 [Deinococcus malanensis]|uniref:hypothetical protein n=1 Tax=Deinococcus malanensis TaxID=1706855 RepID=UPI003626192F